MWNLCRGGMKMAQMYDVLVIGAGVVGCSAARELSKYQLKIAVAEKGRMCVWKPVPETLRYCMHNKITNRER